MRGHELGDGQGGVWTAAQARAAGLTAEQVRRGRERGEWQAVRRGVHLSGGVEPDPDHRAWAAVLAAGGPGRAVAVGRTAARLHGLPLVDDDDAALGRRELEHDDVAVSTTRRGGPTLHTHAWSYAPPDLGSIRGCPTASLRRTLWDLRLVLRPDALVCVLDAALHSSRVTREELAASAVAGARGCRAFRTAVGLADGRAESPLETLVRLLLLPVVPGLVPQVEVHDASARLLARVDLGDERLRLAVEADGRSHDGDVALRRDRDRERRVGWTFERVSWYDARRQPVATTARVADTAARLEAAARLRSTA